MPLELYYKPNFGRRLRKITQAAAASLKKINNALYSSIGQAAATVPTVTTDVAIASGATAVGSTLTATPGTYTGSPTLTYQWKNGAADIVGATNPTLDTTGLSAGDSITVIETATNAAGAVDSTSAAVVLTAAVAAPTVTTDVAIASGATTVGSTLTATPGTYTGSPALTYQWQAGATDIPGETNATLDTTGLNVGDSITVVETATNAGGAIDSTSVAVVLT